MLSCRNETGLKDALRDIDFSPGHKDKVQLCCKNRSKQMARPHALMFWTYMHIWSALQRLIQPRIHERLKSRAWCKRRGCSCFWPHQLRCKLALESGSQ